MHVSHDFSLQSLNAYIKRNLKKPLFGDFAPTLKGVNMRNLSSLSPSVEATPAEALGRWVIHERGF